MQNKNGKLPCRLLDSAQLNESVRSDDSFNGKGSLPPAGKSNKSGSSESREKNGAVEKAPVVFYCTRTHKQIKQIISEMHKLPQTKDTKFHSCFRLRNFKDSSFWCLRMTILSSREHSCIYEDEPSTSYSGLYTDLSKNERCKKLLDSKEVEQLREF